MIRKIAAVYSILIGISVLCMWGMIILTGGIIEGPIQISFHLVSEFLMALDYLRVKSMETKSSLFLMEC